mmetsp:Transcript_18435/g.43086  ORF Transcript_18435/g.43086 Transcript_18435/m.43086 type:complete len:266 (-) Transcript_18435:2107-2904(-)
MLLRTSSIGVFSLLKWTCKDTVRACKAGSSGTGTNFTSKAPSSHGLISNAMGTLSHGPPQTDKASASWRSHRPGMSAKVPRGVQRPCEEDCGHCTPMPESLAAAAMCRHKGSWSLSRGEKGLSKMSTTSERRLSSLLSSPLFLDTFVSMPSTCATMAIKPLSVPLFRSTWWTPSNVLVPSQSMIRYANICLCFPAELGICQFLEPQKWTRPCSSAYDRPEHLPKQIRPLTTKNGHRVLFCMLLRRGDRTGESKDSLQIPLGPIMK